MTVRVRSWKLYQLLLPHLSPDFLHLPYVLVHILSHFIVITMPAGYGLSKPGTSHLVLPQLELLQASGLTPLPNDTIPFYSAQRPGPLLHSPPGHFPCWAFPLLFFFEHHPAVSPSSQLAQDIYIHRLAPPLWGLPPPSKPSWPWEQGSRREWAKLGSTDTHTLMHRLLNEAPDDYRWVYFVHGYIHRL